MCHIFLFQCQGNLSLDCDEAKQDIEPDQPKYHLENSFHHRLEQLQHLQAMAQLTYRALVPRKLSIKALHSPARFNYEPVVIAKPK